MKKLGEGYILCEWDSREGAYTRISLSQLPNRRKENRKISLKVNNLGEWKKVRLWAEVIKEKK